MIFSRLKYRVADCESRDDAECLLTTMTSSNEAESFSSADWLLYAMKHGFIFGYGVHVSNQHRLLPTLRLYPFIG
jgi:hypoxanthine-guanine phosphoribosyltransferase